MRRTRLFILLFVLCNLCISAQDKSQQGFSGVQIENPLGKDLTIELQSCIGNKYAQIVHLRTLFTQHFAHQAIKITGVAAFDEKGNKYDISPYGGKSEDLNQYMVAKSHPRKIPMQVNKILSSVSKLEKVELEVLLTKPYQTATVILKNVPILWKE